MDETLIEEAYKLCENCKWTEPHDCSVPIGFDDDGNIIYKRRTFICGNKPWTKDGKLCPYYEAK